MRRQVQHLVVHRNRRTQLNKIPEIPLFPSSNNPSVPNSPSVKEQANDWTLNGARHRRRRWRPYRKTSDNEQNCVMAIAVVKH